MNDQQRVLVKSFEKALKNIRKEIYKELNKQLFVILFFNVLMVIFIYFSKRFC